MRGILKKRGCQFCTCELYCRDMDFVLSGITSATLERKDELVRVRLVYSSILKRLGPVNSQYVPAASIRVLIMCGLYSTRVRRKLKAGSAFLLL